MKSTGIVRRIDDLGRVVIPKEIRKSRDIIEGDQLELFVEGDMIIFQKCDDAKDATSVLVRAMHFIRHDCEISDVRKEEVIAKLEETIKILGQN